MIDPTSVQARRAWDVMLDLTVDTANPGRTMIDYWATDPATGDFDPRGLQRAAGTTWSDKRAATSLR